MMEKADQMQAKTDMSIKIVSDLKDLMIGSALPLWSGVGWDERRGGFVERLLVDGTPDLDATRRVRVQARQIYCYATAARLGWYDKGRPIALNGLEYLLAKARHPEGGFVHLLAPDGSVHDPRRDSYDHAFVLLALASVFALTKDAQVRREIDAVLNYLDTRLRSPHGGALEGVPHALPRRQNPQMHLFEAMIALYEATSEEQFQTRAGEYFSLFLANLFDQKTQTLGEYFEEDWAPVPPAVVEPGHQAEWVWLLRGFERITGCPTGKYRAALLASALHYTDPTGCLVDEGDVAGNVTRSTRRLWPQTEIAKAWIAQAETAEEGAEEKALQALVRLNEHYLRHPVRGGWYDQFDADGKSLVSYVPASSFYHVICAISEADLVFDQR